MWLGIDHGMNHPTVALWLAMSPESDYFFIREYAVLLSTDLVREVRILVVLREWS